MIRSPDELGKAMSEEAIDADRILERVCQLPIAFYGSSKSMARLVADSGIDVYPALLTVQNVKGCIATRPELVDSWLQWSENKRVTSGWYFRRHVNRFEVGHYPDGEVSTFCDPSLACAEFVVREVGTLLAALARN